MYPNPMRRSGRPKSEHSSSETTTFRHNKLHSTIINNAMEEYGLAKSAMIRHIILEWNLLRQDKDNEREF